MRRLQVCFLLFFVLAGCKPTYKLINGINKQIKFESLNDYKKYINKHTKLNTKNVYFINNENYNEFLFDIYKKRVIYYYGIIKNEVLIADGSNLEDMNTCYGSILKAINRDVQNTEVIGKSNLINFSYFNISNQSVNLDLSRQTVIFVYSYKLGRLSKNLEYLINETQESKALNYIIISLDNSDISI